MSCHRAVTADSLPRSAAPIDLSRRGLARPVPSLRLGMLSTYPPTVCGLATFASALERGLRSLGHRVDMVGIDDGTLDSPTFGLSVAAVLRHGSHRSALRAAATLNQCDAAIVQHEYGIYGGDDGAEVLDVVRALDVPAVIVLHTVPVRPTPNQAAILVRLCAMADLVVVMTECAGQRLTSLYPVDRTKVITIAHGALVGNWHNQDDDDRDAAGSADLHVLSWGLLGPGKGVERVIDAIGELAAGGIQVQYTVAGRTHPKVAARQGETYRASLIERAHARSVADLVTFDQAYRNPEALTDFIAGFGAIIMAYDSLDQVTSGVLVDSIASGRPVIATAFPHAVELLGDGAGIVVPHGDQQALVQAIAAVTGDAAVRQDLTAQARSIAPSLSWTAIAGQYARAAAELARTDAAPAWLAR